MVELNNKIVNAIEAFKTVLAIAPDGDVKAAFTTFKAKVMEAKLTITVAVEDGAVTLKLVGENIPDEIKKIYDCSLAIMAAYKSIITDAPKLTTDITAVVEKITALDPAAEAEGANISGMELMKMVKNVGKNTKTLSGAPTTLQTIVANVNTQIDEIIPKFRRFPCR